jgi:hypothetical protein
VVRFNTSIRQELAVPDNLDPPGARTIASGPLYSAHEVSTVLDSFNPSVVLWTEDCNKDVFLELGWDLAQVAALVREAVVGGRRIASEWCEQKPDGPCAPCDSYEVIRPSGKPKKMYVKFAIAKTGMSILVVSCHEARPKK